MNNGSAELARKQLERRIAPLRELNLIAPPRGWIKAIRESLGMTGRQLAHRMGVKPSRIPVIERAELTGATTLRTLRQAAAAMNCSFVYAFVPVASLESIVRERAAEKAREEVEGLHHSMRLEQQALLPADLMDEHRRAVERILTGSLRGLWEDRG